MTRAPALPASSRLPTEPAECQLCPAPEGTEPLASGWDFEYQTCPDQFRLVRCTGCGLVFLWDRPTADAMETIYPPHYYSFQETAHENRLVKRVRDRLEKRKAASYLRLLGAGPRAVLDVGCGDGRLLDVLRAHCPPTWQLSGVEISEAAAARARANGHDVTAGDVEALDLRSWDGRFDLVLMHQVLEHTRSPRHTIRKVRALLKPGGVFSVETPDTRSWDARLFRRRYWGGYHIPRHFYLFNKAVLSRLLEEEGFEVLSARSILSPVFWIHSVHNYLVDHPSLARWGRFAHYQSPVLLAAATAVDLFQIALRSQSSNMRILAQRTIGS